MEHPLWLVYTTAVVILLLQVSGSQYQQQTFYIKPENSSQCPVNVSSFYCKDLPTFVLESRQLLHQNTSLLFLPGHHHLISTLLIANIKEFIMAIHNISDRMKNYTRIQINCSNHANPSMHVENVSFVRIDSISFYQCGPLLFRSIPHGIVTDDIWNKSRDSAIILERSSTIINNCHITDALCYKCSGSGLHAEQSNVTFTGLCKITE